jgi:hypothetical protein
MGTSQSSGGPGGGVPMVPPWTPSPPADSGDAGPRDGGDGGGDDGDGEPSDPADGPLAAPAAAPPALVRPVPIAPGGRFAGARRSLGEFARSGDAGDMRQSLGHYVRRGYGGAATAARRFGGTAATADALDGTLATVATGQAAAPGSPLDPALLAGRSVEDVMDAVVEAVRPVDGTQDAEAERASIRDALSELLTRYPDADLLNLERDQRAYAIERFAATDVYRRFDLDLGKALRDKAPSAVTALSRLKQVKDYVKETVAAAFRRMRDAGRAVTAGRVNQIVRDALRDTFEVFEGYSE